MIPKPRVGSTWQHMQIPKFQLNMCTDCIHSTKRKKSINLLKSSRMLAGLSQVVKPVLYCHRSILTPRMVSQNAIPFKPFNENLSNLGTNIFSVMTALSLQHKSINLGQVGLGLFLFDQL